MRMCDLPRRIISPLGDDRNGGRVKIIHVNRWSLEEVDKMEIGERIAVPNNMIARKLNQKKGLGSYSNIKEGDQNYLVRNK